MIGQLIYLFIEPIKETLQKEPPVHVHDAQLVSKSYHNWFNKWTFHQTNQSEIYVLESQ